MTTDLKLGDIVKHPEKGRGIINRTLAQQLGVYYVQRDGSSFASTSDLTGWERVEICTADERRILDDFREVASGEAQEAVYPEEGVVIASHDAFKQRPELVRPGHVQVRVDDLDRQTLSEWSQWMAHCIEDEALVRIGRAMIASQVEHGDPSPHWPADEKPTSTTVTLYCPDCGEAVHVTVVMLGRQGNGERWLGLRDSYVHTCPLRHADEPTEAGILLEIKYLRYVSIVLKGRVEYVSVDKGGIFEWSYLVNLANEMNESIKLGWGQE